MPWDLSEFGCGPEAASTQTGPHVYRYIVKPNKLETGLRPNSAGIPCTLLFRIEAIGFPTLGLLLYAVDRKGHARSLAFRARCTRHKASYVQASSTVSSTITLNPKFYSGHHLPFLLRHFFHFFSETGCRRF